MAGNTQTYYKRIKRLEEIKALDPIAFERYAGTLFEWMGWTVNTTPITGDKGVDLLLRKQNRTAVVQCKRYEGTVSASVVRDLYGVMVHNMADEAYLVTTGTISLPAQQWASGKPIHLVDGNTLIEWANSFDHEKEEARQREEQAQRAIEAQRKRANLFNRIKTTLVSSTGVIVLLVIPTCCGLLLVCWAIMYALSPQQSTSIRPAQSVPVATQRQAKPTATKTKAPAAQPATFTTIPPSPIPTATGAPARMATIQAAPSATGLPAATAPATATSLPTTAPPTWTPRPISTPRPTWTTEPTWTPRSTWTPRPTSTNWPTSTSVQVPAFCDCAAGDVLNCSDFSSQAQAQACFEHCGGTSNDVFKLDQNNNGIACEEN